MRKFIRISTKFPILEIFSNTSMSLPVQSQTTPVEATTTTTQHNSVSLPQTMSLSLWSFADPWPEMRRMQREIDNLFGALDRSFSSGAGETFWSPACDIKETEKDCLIHAELPGLKKEDISIEFKDNMLTISGEKKDEKTEKTDKYHRVERSWGKFSRSVMVPEGIKDTDITAKFENGVLEVRFPKPIQNEPERKLITIQ